MKVLVAHNSYIHRGGEDVCVEHEVQALQEAGVSVQFFRVQNKRATRHRLKALAAPFGLGFEGDCENQLALNKPDILHIHNLYPLLSARLVPKAQRLGIKTVLTLHNYRPLCLNGLFLTPRHEICERCAGRHFGPGIVRGCYRQSRIQSTYLAAHLAWAKWQSWYQAVDLFIAPTAFLRDKFVSYGFPAAKIVVQGHFLPQLPSEKPHVPEPYVLYLGRLSEEKGVRWLLELFKTPRRPVTLRIAGDGPMRKEVLRAASPFIHYAGYLGAEAKDHMIKKALAVVMPSQCYENFPITVMEANACGVPVIVSALGGLAEMVASEENGRAFQLNNPDSFWDILKTYAQKDSMGERTQSQRYAQQHFSQTAFLQKRLGLYKNLLAKTGIMNP